MRSCSPGPDTVLDACRSDYRRLVLATLADHQRTLSLTGLAEMIVEHDDSTPLSAVSTKTIAEIRITLHHVHIPKFEEAGLVEYDFDRQLVERTALFDEISPQLSALFDAHSELAASSETEPC